MSLRVLLLLAFAAISLGRASPSGNQVDVYRPVIRASWQHRVDQNHGVHAWSRRNDGMRVFQEWIALLSSAREAAPAVRRKLGMDLQAYVVDADIGPLGFIGTSLPVPGYDQGDFDMSLLGCSSLIGLFLDNRDLLTDATLVHLIKKVVRTWGQTPKSYFDVFFVSIPETENHLFMTESTRYLTNQIIWENTRNLPEIQALRDSLTHAGVVIDNSRGMLKSLLLKVMHQAMCKGFFEFNAQIYQRFTLQALDNLYSFAHDPAISTGSACLLDYLSAIFAFQSLGSIRYGPYRRSSEVYQDISLVDRDAVCSFFSLQSGAFGGGVKSRLDLWKNNTAHASMALYSAELKYRIPEPILAYMQNQTWEYRAEIRSGYAGKGTRSRATEVYYGGNKFLLTAGGRYESYAGPNFPSYRYWFSDAPWVYDVITRSSSLLLDPEKEKPAFLQDILHFQGVHWRSNNMAIHRNFLYGYTAVAAYNSSAWPQRIPFRWTLNGTGSHIYSTRDFDFRFLDRSASGVYIVLGRVRPSKTFLRWGYQKYLRGTIEVVDTSRVKSLAALTDSVLFLNSPHNRWPLGPRRYVYVNIDGEKLHLNSRYDGSKNGILRVEPGPVQKGLSVPDIVLPFDFPRDGPSPQFQVEMFSPWQGATARSDGIGNMFIFDPASGGYVVSSFREWWNPQRILVEGF